MSSQLGGDPAVNQLDLTLQKTNVFQGQIKDAMDRQSQCFIQGKTLPDCLLELARVVRRVS
jgi:hypothetical protein